MGRKWVLQMDNDHKGIFQSKLDNKDKLLEWPSESPDLKLLCAYKRA